MANRTVEDTDRSRNIQVAVTGDTSLDDMEALLAEVGTGMGLILSHITTLSRKKFPGNRHWHFKKDPKAKGCLDVTYWPEGALLWITIRHYEPDWVHRSGRDMAARLKERLAAAGCFANVADFDAGDDNDCILRMTDALPA